MEELQKVNVVFLLTEVFLEEEIDSRFEEERVIDGDESNFLVAEPAWLTTTGHARVHDII